MYNLIPVILIFVSLAIIIFIVVRKFSVLSNLNIDSMQEEKEAKFKEQIIKNRFKRSVVKWTSKGGQLVKPATEAAAGSLKNLYERLQQIKENYQTEKKTASSPALEDIKTVVSRLFTECEELVKREEYNDAEKKLIEIIRLDSKSIKAFKLLGEVYYFRKEYSEAKQTLEHVLKLLEEIVDEYEGESAPNSLDLEMTVGEAGHMMAETYFDLANICQKNEDVDTAFGFLKKSLKLEPNNPRFLDMILELSIIKKDKISALEYYEKMAQSNPDNQKLELFKKQIEEL